MGHTEKQKRLSQIRAFNDQATHLSLAAAAASSKSAAAAHGLLYLYFPPKLGLQYSASHIPPLFSHMAGSEIHVLSQHSLLKIAFLDYKESEVPSEKGA